MHEELLPDFDDGYAGAGLKHVSTFHCAFSAAQRAKATSQFAQQISGSDCFVSPYATADFDVVKSLLILHTKSFCSEYNVNDLDIIFVQYKKVAANNGRIDDATYDSVAASLSKYLQKVEDASELSDLLYEFPPHVQSLTEWHSLTAICSHIIHKSQAFACNVWQLSGRLMILVIVAAVIVCLLIYTVRLSLLH